MAFAAIISNPYKVLDPMLLSKPIDESMHAPDWLMPVAPGLLAQAYACAHRLMSLAPGLLAQALQGASGGFATLLNSCWHACVRVFEQFWFNGMFVEMQCTLRLSVLEG
jgi:hypothetical protein